MGTLKHQRSWRALCAALLALPLSVAAAQAGHGGVASSRAAEMPELSGWGKGDVGTEFHALTSAGRRIGVRLWYPAQGTPGVSAVIYRHVRSGPGEHPSLIVERGRAIARARPVAGKRFPLLLLSHGYGGWDTHMSRLGEVLASRGYVVASIDHDDQPVHDLASFMASFGAVLLHRSADQQLVLHDLLAGEVASNAVAAETDDKVVGLIGYSMGGYGALITAGGAVSPGAPAFAQLSATARGQLPRADPVLASKIKAVVALAPWGAQPGSLVWSDAALAELRAPLLLVDGDQDDVVDFAHGVRRIFTQATGCDRYLLVYREAAHNIAGNPVSLPQGADFAATESAGEPVWRKDRIEAINEHFIVAFLDHALKGIAERARYLDVPTPVSDDGVWPLPFGQQVGGKTAGDAQPGYWRGFQRRWARGMELHHKAAGE